MMEVSLEGAVLSNGCSKEQDDVASLACDSASYEKSILDEMDSYWDDLNARLTVSRMVSDSIIKGMVNAMQEEATEKIAIKDAEVAALNERLHHYEPFSLKLDPPEREMEIVRCSPGAGQELDFDKQLEDLASEQQWSEGVRGEIIGIIVRSHIRRLKDEFETKLGEQHSLMDTISKNWRRRIDEISLMRHDLDDIYKSLSNPDLCIGNINEQNNGKRKDIVSWKKPGSQLLPAVCSKELSVSDTLTEKSDEFGKLVPNDSPQLKRMTKEELITYFKMEMNKMKRQHEIALQEKTEELFGLKRSLLNEKGSSPLHFISKEKDFELMKKKISELILKLDEILLENKELPTVFYDQDILHWLKEKIDTFFLENQWPHDLQVDERKETGCIVLPQASTELNSGEEIERLRLAIEEVEMTAIIKEEKYRSVLKALFDEIERDWECLETMSKIVEDNYCIVYGAVISDVFSSITHIIGQFQEQKDLFDTELLKKQDVILVESEKNEMLNHEIASLLVLVKEKEELVLEAGSELVNQKEQFDLVCNELDTYREQISKQEAIMENTKNELDSLKCKLDDSIQQIHQKELLISNLNQKLMITRYDLTEMERENSILQNEIREQQEKLLSAIRKDQEQKQLLESIVSSITESSKTISSFGCMTTQKINTYGSRLDHLSHQCRQIKQQGDILRRKVSWYKERFEVRCEDLRRAENEVDLLGDEVDALSSLLEKIYMALDHYSPVLQHYPGVVETLKLIRRELDEEITKSA